MKNQDLYSKGFNEGIRTAIVILKSKGYDRTLSILNKMLEVSQSRPPEILQDRGGHDTPKGGK